MAFDVEQFKKTLIYESQGPAIDLLADLDSLGELDKHNEAVAKRWLQAGGLTIVAALAVFIAGLVLETSWMLVTAVGVLALGIAAFVIRMRFSRLDTEDRRYQLLGTVVRLLQTDLADDQELRVTLDLSRPKQKHKLERKGHVGHWNVEYYEDPWLKMTTRLLDGTTCQLQVTEHFQYRHRWARSASGKSKHKSKTKSATRAALRLKVRAKKYPGLGELAGSAQEAVQLPPTVMLKSLRVESPYLALQVATKEPWGVGTTEKPLEPLVTEGSEIVAMMFMSLYQVLNLARKMEATA